MELEAYQKTDAYKNFLKKQAERKRKSKCIVSLMSWHVFLVSVHALFSVPLRIGFLTDLENSDSLDGLSNGIEVSRRHVSRF